MMIEPKVRGFICTTAHPDGCKEHVRRQMEYVKQNGSMPGPKKVLVIGCSSGYGLATRIAAAYGCGASTLGVMFERPASEKRTASAGYYNTAAFEKYAKADGLYAKTINADAFSAQVKQQVIAQIKEDLGQVDMVVYSLAAPKRTAPDGVTYSSVLKTTGEPFTNKTMDLKTNQVTDVTIPAATDEEIAATVKVMGGEDWMDWMEALSAGEVLAPGALTLAYSYIGPALTHPVYDQGSIGMAKHHLYQTAGEITRRFADKGIKAYISVNKALVTQASAAIPIVPLYISILYKVMKEKGLHEGCIEQMDRLFREKLPAGPVVDEKNRIRLDDYELREDVQAKVMDAWQHIRTENAGEYADVDGYWEDFYHIFGFGFDGVDYSRDVPLV